MPPPRKIDLMPAEVRDWLKTELEARGFAEIEEVTEALNFRLEQAGQRLTIGKTAVGNYSKALKDQREAFSIAETLLADMDIEAEGELQQTLVQMIAASAVHLIVSVREQDGHLEPKDLMNLGRMLKDLMASSGMREKLLADERARIARTAKQEAAETVEKQAKELGLGGDTVAAIKKSILGVRDDEAE